MTSGVTLDIPNVRQTGNGLCWAACLVPIVAYVTGKTISQHDLCAAARRHPEEGATTTDMACALMRTAGIRAHYTSPLSAEATFKHLANGRPLILVVNVGHGFVGHSLCLRGLLRNGVWSALVNEPNLANEFSVHVPFARLRAAWREGLVIQGRST